MSGEKQRFNWSFSCSTEAVFFLRYFSATRRLKKTAVIDKSVWNREAYKLTSGSVSPLALLAAIGQLLSVGRRRRYTFVLNVSSANVSFASAVNKVHLLVSQKSSQKHLSDAKVNADTPFCY